MPAPEPDEDAEDDAFLEVFSSVSISADATQVASLRFIVNSNIPSSTLEIVDVESQNADAFRTRASPKVRLEIASFARLL